MIGPIEAVFAVNHGYIRLASEFISGLLRRLHEWLNPMLKGITTISVTSRSIILSKTSR